MNIAPEEMPRELARLEEENEELHNIINEIEKAVKIAIEEDNYDGGIYDIESILESDKE